MPGRLWCKKLEIFEHENKTLSSDVKRPLLLWLQDKLHLLQQKNIYIELKWFGILLVIEIKKFI